MIVTNRLFLYPLTYPQLLKYAKCDNSLEAELGLRPSSRSISAELHDALEQTIIPNVADSHHNYLYSTIWTAISKNEHTMVADLCFYGEPDAGGMIEIGYGTHSEFQNRGFMTEAVGGMVKWAEAQTGISAIIASTEKSNPASSRVLEKNGFVQVSESNTLLNWKLELH